MTFDYKNIFKVLVICVILIATSCSEDPDPVKPGSDGFYVVNEGGFGNGNSSISFFDRSTGQVTNDIFKAANGRDLGDQAQSMTVFEYKGYIVVQNSGKIEVINADDQKSIATIVKGIQSPRYFIGVSPSKAYVSDWSNDGVSGRIKIINLTSNTVTDSIDIGKGPDRMIKVGNLVYVANSGGYDKDNTVKVIDSNTNQVTATITVGDNPSGLQVDGSGNIWVGSAGATAYNDDYTIDEANSTKGSLSKITSENTEAMRLTVGGLGSVSSLSVSPDGNSLYYNYNDAVYSMKTSDTALPTTPFKAKKYYGLSVSPFDGSVIGCISPNFGSAGSIDIMDNTGAIQNTYAVGIGPNSCSFK
ncbi:MAG: YncE family protein [Chryseolinea sp.]